MKVFITGATGFIGTHLVRRLAPAGHELRCLVRGVSRAGALAGQGAILVPGDVAHRDSVLRGMSGCDWVMHLANVYSFWLPDRRTYAEVNVEGTRTVMECALDAGVSKVVHVSTAAIYGRPADVPYTEASAIGPVQFSEYARTKYLGDRVAWEFHEKQGLPLVTILPGAALGPGDAKATGQYVQDLIRRRMPARVMEDSVLTFVHVRDVAEAIVRAAETTGNVGEKYLVGKYRLSFRELNRMVSEISGVPLPRMRLPDSLVMASAPILTWLADRIGRPPLWGMSTDQIRTMKEGFQFDGSKAERELGIAYTPIRVTVEEAIASYRA
jgi:dihydroflavonol-4-reductase